MGYNIQTVSSLNGSFKQRHLPKLQKLVNEDQVLTQEIPFEDGIKEGALFRQPVYLTRPHGITFAPSDSAPTLVSPVAAQTKELSFDAYQMIMRERISYDAADRMAGSDAAYITSTGDLPTWLRLSHMHYVEMMLWYGQSTNGIGVVNATPSANTVTITAATWAPQIWVGSENMRLDVYRSTTYVKTVSVTAYNLDFASAAGGTVSVDSGVGILASDILYPAGSYGNVYRGIDTIITESTNQFGQSPTTYNLLKGIDHDVGTATLKFKQLLYGLAKAKAKGLSKRALLLLSEFAFPDLVDEVEAARTDAQRKGGYAKDSPFRGTEIERGADAMTVHSPSGTLEIRVSSYCMKGYAYGMIKDGSWKRYGTSDVTFTMPGGKNDEDFYMHLPEVAGYELRTWSNFANYTPRAGSNVRFKNILNGIDGGV